MPRSNRGANLISTEVARQAGKPGATMVIMMDRVPPQPVQDPPNLILSGSFSLDRLLSHIDPDPAEESEDFVNRIYEQRRIDLSSDRNGMTGR